MRIPNVLNNAIDWSEVKFATLDDKETNTILLKDGDLLFVRTNGNPEYIGRCAVFRSNRRAAYASYLIRARLTSNSIVSSEYVARTLGTATMRQATLRLARTTAGNYNINIASLSRLLIPIPPMDLQQRYKRIVEATRSMTLIAGSGSGSPSTLNASLMSRLLDSGP